MKRRADSIQFGEIDGETVELVWVEGKPQSSQSREVGWGLRNICARGMKDRISA